MNQAEAMALFGVESEVLSPAFYAQVARCVILDSRISNALFRLYAYLISRCTGESPVTWVSQQTIADDLQSNKGVICRDLGLLAEKGLISIRKHEGRNVYRINDVTKVYGADARKPWSKSRGCHGDNGGVVMVTTGGCHGDNGGVVMVTTKETEGEESEFRNKKEEEGAPPPPPERLEPEIEKPIRAIHQLVGKPMDTEDWSDWVKALKIEFNVTAEEIASLARDWEVKEREKDFMSRTRSPKLTFKKWLINYVRDKHRGPRTGSAATASIAGLKVAKCWDDVPSDCIGEARMG